MPAVRNARRQSVLTRTQERSLCIGARKCRVARLALRAVARCSDHTSYTCSMLDKLLKTPTHPPARPPAGRPARPPAHPPTTERKRERTKIERRTNKNSFTLRAQEPAGWARVGKRWVVLAACAEGQPRGERAAGQRTQHRARRLHGEGWPRREEWGNGASGVVFINARHPQQHSYGQRTPRAHYAPPVVTGEAMLKPFPP